MVGGSISSPDHNDNDKEYSPKENSPPGRINGLVNSPGDGDNGIRVSFTSKHHHNGRRVQESTSDDSDDVMNSEEDEEEEEEAAYFEETTERCLYEDLPTCNGGHRDNSCDSSSSTLYSENSGKNNYERCCDLVRENGCVGTDDEDEVDSRVGQCSRTYTHKRRKMGNGLQNKERPKRHHAPIPTPQNSRIDLTDDEAPVTLTPDLNTVSPEYDLRYSTESIVSIIGCTMADLDDRTRLYEVEEEEEMEEEDSRPPVLRRSVRLNQQEAEESPAPPRLRSKLKDDKKNSKPSKIKLFPPSRSKRKSKELERRVPIKNNNPQKKTKKSHHIAVKPSKTNEHGDSEQPPMKPNTPSSSVNRALWGDMTDVNEDGDGEQEFEFMEYSTSAEIPFAVGLLPLRAALERMQATLDHQPRKTRSSVLMTKQDSSSLKRKNSPIPTNSSSNKRQNTSELEDNPSAVCHIQIRTETSPPRKRSLSDGAASLGQTTGNS